VFHAEHVTNAIPNVYSFLVMHHYLLPIPFADEMSLGSWFGVDLTTDVSGDPDTGTLLFSNLVTAGNGSKITTIYMGLDGYFFDYFAEGTGVIGGDYGSGFTLDETPSTANGPAAWDVEVLGDPRGRRARGVISPGEMLSITYDLVSGVSLQDLIDAFNANPQELGVAFHAQSLPGGDSEKYEAHLTSVPDGGATLTMLGLAMIGLGWLHRKR
jgi:hypothetical protein